MEENKQNSNKLYYLIGGLGSILLGGGIYYLVKNNIFFNKKKDKKDYIELDCKKITLEDEDCLCNNCDEED